MIKSKRVTLKEVAAAVNLAVPTVSQILNGKKNFCSAKQCEKVRETARKMGYITNLGYRIMTGMETHTVGIMVASRKQIQENHIRELILLLTTKLSDLGWASFCHVLPDTPEAAVNKVTEFVGRGVEKLVFIGSPVGYESIFSLLQKNRVPYIGTREWMPCFCRSESYQARLQLLEHLNRKTGGNYYVYWAENQSAVHPFVAHIAATAKDKLIMLPEISDNYSTVAFDCGYNAVKELISSNRTVSGVMFPNDTYALGAAYYLFEHRIENFSLVGFNGDHELLRFPYPVSTGLQPTGEIVDEMTNFFRDNIPRQKLLPVKLILR